MAEATLFVSGKPDDTLAKTCWLDRAALEQGRVLEGPAWGDEAVEVVSCGAVAKGHEVAIVNPHTLHAVSGGEVGEIWVSGPSVAAGYFERPELTASTFDGRIAGTTTDTRYLRTGDLGFLLHGELYVTGRHKDLIIIAGRNLYPQDIELSVLTACDQLRKAAAFSMPGADAEELVVVAEFKGMQGRTAREVEAAREAVRTAVTEEHAVAPAAVHLGPFGTIPVTTSGKVRRDATRTAYRGGTLKQLALAAEQTTLSAL
jgi:acyl-CoA synthetase (AMP-forming)/AMP-acid ligase II